MAARPAKETKAQLLQRIDRYEGSPPARPKSAEDWFLLGVAYAETGKVKEAISALRSALKSDPQNSEAWNRLGISLADAGKVDESVDALQHVVEISPELSEGWINLSLDFIKKGRLSQAERYLKKAQALDRNSKYLWIGYSCLSLAQGKNDAALQALNNSLSIDPRDCYSLFDRGLILYSRHEVSSAIACLQGAVRSSWDFRHARVVLAMWLADLNRLEEAATVARATLARDPSERNSLEIAAVSDIRHHRPAEGIEKILKARALGYDGTDSLNHLVTAMAETGKFEDAEKMATEAMAASPKDENPVASMGIIRLKQNRLEDSVTLFKKALQMNPKNLQALLSLSESYRQQDRQNEAIRFARKALELDPRNADAWLSIGASEERRKDLAAAGAAYEKATECDPGNYLCWQAVASISTQYEKASHAANTALALAPGERTAQTLVDTIERKFKRTDELIASCKKTLKSSPKDFKTARELYRLLAGLGRLEEAEGFFREMIQDHPEAPISWVMLGQVCDAERRYGEAREALLKAVKLDPKDATTWVGLGSISMETAGRPQSAMPGAPLDPIFQHAGTEAEASLRKAIAIEPANAVAYERLSMALIYQNRHVDAQAAARKAISLSDNLASARFDLATSLYFAGNAQEAIGPFAASVRLDPGNFDHWAGLVACYRSMKDLPSGEEMLRQLSAELPDVGASWFFLGSNLAEQNRDREALEFYSKAIALSKTFPVAWNSMGLAHRGLGEVDEELECYRRAVEEMPRYADAWDNMGLAYFTAGKTSEAIDAYQHALNTDPADAKALVNLTQAAAKIGNADLARKTCDELAKVDASMAEETRRRYLK